MDDFIRHPPAVGHSFTYHGNTYYVRKAGWRTVNLLRAIGLDPRFHSARPMLKLRPQIRQAVRTPAPVLVSAILETATNTRVIRLAIWLLGQINKSFAVASLLRHLDHEDFRVRRDVVRTLHRLEAWDALRRIELRHADPQIRSLATPRTPRPWSDRLAHFLATADVSDLPQRPPPPIVTHWAAGQGTFSAATGRKPKSAAEIRRFLRRIRRWARRRSSRHPWGCAGLVAKRW